jgi:hypothetical protein
MDNNSIVAIYIFENNQWVKIQFSQVIEQSLHLQSPENCVNWYCSLSDTPFTKSANGLVWINFRSINPLYPKAQCSYLWKNNQLTLKKQITENCIKL